MLRNTKQDNSPLFSRQRQLQKQNYKLKQQLHGAHQSIARLRGEVEQLKKHIKLLHKENMQTTQRYQDQKQMQLRKSPQSKSNKSLKLIKDFQQQHEVFSSDSGSDAQQQINFKPFLSAIHPLGKEKTRNVYFQEEKGQLSLIKQKSSQIRLRGKNSNNEKSLKKIDSSNAFHPVTYFEVDLDEDNSFTGLQSQHNNKQKFFSMSNINNTKSQKLISVGNRQTVWRNVKQQLKIRQPSQQKVFKKVCIGKPIYDVFFVTGLSRQNQPQILFSFPKTSPHFGPILSLCYSDQFLKVKQNLSNSSKNIMNISTQGNTGKIKQFYVIPLRKVQDLNDQNQRQYLIVSEVEQTILVKRDNVFIACIFQRLYCFISSCQFFNAFKNLTNQFLDKINAQKTQQNIQYLKEDQYKELLQQSLGQPLMILSKKAAQSNHTFNYRLDSFISISIDIPSVDNSYRMVSQYRPHGVLNFKVQLRPVEDYVSCLQTKLFGVLLSYALSQKKIILFSNSKSKISECILHFLQIIKPLQYVCPVLITALKQQHQEYFTAPMSLILGLWVEQKKMQRQKIEIFMNRKENLAGMIQKGKIQISDGVIINLDTGLVYGGGLSQSLNSFALKINEYYQNYCHHPKQIYKLFQKLLEKQINKNQIQIIQIKQKLQNCLSGTQLFSYYKQKKQKKLNFG